MPSTKGLEASLRSFLRESTIAYAEDAVAEEEVEHNLIVGTFSSGPFTMTDTYRVSPDMRVYNGVEEVTHQDDPLWRAAYTGSVLKSVRKSTVPGVLDVYKQVLKSPDPELPIRGPRKMQIGEYEYTLDSVRGPLKVARFAVVEEIKKDGKRLYTGEISGSRMD
jgi:hypothetical protein